MDHFSKKIKVAHVITRLDRGGAPDLVRLLIQGLGDQGFDNYLFYGPTREPSLKTLRLLEALGSKAQVVSHLGREIHFFKDLRAFVALVRIFHRERFHVVHLHTAKAGVLGRLAAWLTRTPLIIYSPHGHDFYGYFGKWGSLCVVCAERFAALFCHKIHALTQLEKKDLIDFRITAARKIEVIYSGVELETLKPSSRSITELKALTSLPGKSLRVGMVGRLEPVKGAGLFIEMASEVSKRRSDVSFCIAGDGSLRSSLEERMKTLKLEKDLSFLGWLEDPEVFMMTLDLLVMPSLNEAVGRSALEAQALGVPVVATRVGGVPEIVKDEVTGILIDPGSPQSLRDAVLRLLNDETLRKNMGQAARAWIDERFSDKAMCECFARLYARGLKRS